MSEYREELLARQKACGVVLKDLQAVIKHEGLESDEDQVSVIAIAFQLYITAYAMKKEYWGAAFLMADRFCEFAGIGSMNLRESALGLVNDEIGKN